MDYELAKQLKDAGFPQNTNNEPYLEDGLGITNEHYASCPGLEELIEACGENLICLMRKSDWLAIGKDKDIQKTGSTPSEAVARLWLAINNK